jgi:hypothetical protein
MKCWKHPDEDATDTCAKCGNAVCDICSTRSDNAIICVECTEKEALSSNISSNPTHIESKEKKKIPFLVILYISLGIGAFSFCWNHLPDIMTRGYWNRGDFIGATVFIPWFLIILAIWAAVIYWNDKPVHRKRGKNNEIQAKDKLN